VGARSHSVKASDGVVAFIPRDDLQRRELVSAHPADADGLHVARAPWAVVGLLN
jgi:hypothetical protein